jgi:hypothetical protein
LFLFLPISVCHHRQGRDRARPKHARTR